MRSERGDNFVLVFWWSLSRAGRRIFGTEYLKGTSGPGLVLATGRVASVYNSYP